MSTRWLPCPRCQVLIPVDEARDRLPAQCPVCQAALATPAPPEPHWFYAQNKQKLGPVPWSQLRQLAAAGKLAPTDMLLPAGGGKWAAAATIAGLFPAPASADVPLPTLAHYEILHELGRGGMGVVYKARQRQLNRIVALKMILAGEHAGPDQLARFRAEGETLARLQHPNIVQIHEVGEWRAGEATPAVPFFSLEFVDGGGLDQKIAGRPLPPLEAAQLALTLARAVHHAHQHGIIHRDLKPANVLLTQAGQPKIADFGLAKHLDTAGAQTRSGAILGSPSYLAPEQAAGRSREIGPATDVYALGAILYEMLTGAPPFRGESSLDTVLLVMTQEPVRPRGLQPGLPRDLETICLKCLNKPAAKRYPSALALADDLSRFVNGETILARPVGPVERSWRWCRRNPVPASLLVVVTLLLIVVSLGSAFGLYHLSRLSEELVRSTAIESAAQQSEMLESLNSFYSAEVVDRVKPFGIEVTHDYVARRGAIPLPATLTIDLGNHISASSERGQQVRLYSDQPFKSRKGGGPRDAFEWEALGRLRLNPQEPVTRFEDVDGKPTLRYATARVMKESCLKCHNTHPESPRTNWQVGDVRGVVEIIRPLEHDVQRTRDGLRSSFLLIGVLSAVLLAGLSAAVLVVGLWSRRQAARLEAGRGDSGAGP